MLSKNKIQKKEERTHIHFITRLEMKLLVVIADSDFDSWNFEEKMRVIQFFGSIIIWWWFSGLPIMDFYETFFSSCYIHFLCSSCQYYTLNDPKSDSCIFLSTIFFLFVLCTFFSISLINIYNNTIHHNFLILSRMYTIMYYVLLFCVMKYKRKNQL